LLLREAARLQVHVEMGWSRERGRQLAWQIMCGARGMLSESQSEMQLCGLCAIVCRRCRFLCVVLRARIRPLGR